MNSFTPLPENIGVGFTAKQPLEDSAGYEYKPLKGFHNYHVTPQAWAWPEPYQATEPKTIDGFSPNLNKQLHCGHVKNLAVAAALANILEGKPVAMLGASLGILPEALATYHKWCQLAGYKPSIYLDTQLPRPKIELTPGTGDYAGCQMLGETVVYKSDGSPTYAAHDLAFAQLVGPDYYLTGNEQKSHFEALGLGDKHLALGLVLGPDGKKMRSTIKLEGEEANATTADELFQTMLECLKETPFPTKLAWNILAFQFNSSTVQSNTKFNPQEWAKPEAPGMYVSYTYARIANALKGAGPIPAAPTPDIDQDDAQLLGVASYYTFAQAKAKAGPQPNVLANFALQLSKKLSNLYKKKQIQGGNPGFIFATATAHEVLGQTMALLGMHTLEKV